MKTCTKCGVEKDEGEFYKYSENNNGHKRHSSKDGCVSPCKECFKEYRKNHREKRKESARIYYQKYKKSEKYSEDHDKRRNSKKEYQNSSNGRITIKRYRQSEKCKKIERDAWMSSISLLDDKYIIKQLRADMGLTTKTIKEYPELIEVKRIIIKTKRLCKTLTN